MMIRLPAAIAWERFRGRPPRRSNSALAELRKGRFLSGGRRSKNVRTATDCVTARFESSTSPSLPANVFMYLSQYSPQALGPPSGPLIGLSAEPCAYLSCDLSARYSADAYV